MKIEVKSRWTGGVLLSVEAGSLRLALEAAVRDRANLRDANLRDADLGDADLRGAELGGANLGGANLGGANLGGANLGGANLGGANLRDANLGGANLRDANLRDADLRDADLRGANLGGAYLGGANLGGAPILGDQPDGWRAHAWLDKDKVLRVQVGCHAFALAQARAYWAGKEHRREIVAWLDYVERVAEIRGWVVPTLPPAVVGPSTWLEIQAPHAEGDRSQVIAYLTPKTLLRLRDDISALLARLGP